MKNKTGFFSKQLWWGLVGLILIVAVGIRFYNLANLPPSPYWEEVALGYDAFALAETGKDHHGNSWPIVALESFGDYKPALYAYAVIPVIKVFGLSVWSVRVPAALAGLAAVVAVGGLIWQLSPKPWRQWATLAGLLVAALSPWGILFSRAAWEVNLATALIAGGVWAGLAVLQREKNPHKIGLMITATVLLVLSLYAYHAARIVAPLLGLGLAWEWWRQGQRSIKYWVLLTLLAVILASPLIRALGTQATGQRWAETSLLADGRAVLESNQRRAEQPGLISYLFYHRYVISAREITQAYLSHFTASFLFISGDANVRHSTGFMGQLYHVEVVFLLLGLAFAYQHRQRGQWLLAWWLVIGILPAAITTGSPHALRILLTWPVWMIVIGWGLVAGWLLIVRISKEVLGLTLSTKLAWVYIGLIGIMYLVEFSFFWRYYTRIYPQVTAGDWQFGYQEVIDTLNQAEQQHPEAQLYLTREQGRPAMYYWFYSQTDPRRVQAFNNQAKKDQGEFLNFEKVNFINNTTQVVRPAIVAASPEQIEFLRLQTPQNLTVLKTVNSPIGKPIWEVVYYE